MSDEGFSPQPAASDVQAGPATDLRVGIVVWSTDPALRELAAASAREPAELFLVDQQTEITTALDRHGCQAVLIDADPLQPAQLDSLLDALNRHPAAPIIIAAASKEPAKVCMERLHAGRINRLLLKPASSGALRLALDYAVARRRKGGKPEAVPQSAPRKPDQRRVPLLAGAGALALVLVIAAFLVLRGSPDPSPTSTPVAVALQQPSTPLDPEPAAAEPPLVEPIPIEPGTDAEALVATEEGSPELDLALVESVEALMAEALVAAAPGETPEDLQADEITAEAAVAELESAEPPAPREIDLVIAQADARLQAGNLVEPEGDSALDFFQRAAAMEADDSEVLALRARLDAAAQSAVRAMLETGALAEATQFLAAGRARGLTPGLASQLTAELAATQARLRTEQQAALEDELLQTALARLRDGQLAEPNGDSAAYYLGRLRQENPQHPGFAEPFDALFVALWDQATTAIDEFDFEQAETAIYGLGQLAPGGAMIGDLSASLASARRQQEFLTTPAAPSDFDILHMEAVEYPLTARRRGIEGWVDLQLVVDRDGLARDVEVVAAEPLGIFDAAAVAAVQRYRFDPYRQDGTIYERLLALRIEFVLD